MKRVAWLITGVIIVIALSIRLSHFAGRTPFEWDQNRDYGEVKKIASGQYVPLGPIAKGTAGGFYLGSLYYYLLTPAYTLMEGNLRALPVTSIVIDTLVAGLIYLLLKGVIGKGRALSLALLWTVAWFLIETSRISWNVALIPLWSLLTLFAFYQVIENHSARYFYLLAFLAGLTVHIHVTTIPVIPLLLLICFRRFSFPLSAWVKAICLSIIPSASLLIYDFTHSFSNLRLVKDFFSHRSLVTTTLSEMVVPTLTKLGKVVSALFVSTFRDNLILGAVTLILACKSWFSKNVLMQLSGAMIVITTALILFFRDYGFPEYYFASSYLAIFIVVVGAVFDITTRLGKLTSLIQVAIISTLLVINIRAYTSEPTSLSLGVKEQIVDTLTVYQEPIDVNYNFDPGRDGGLRDLVRLKGIKLDPQAKTRLLITDKLNTPLYIEGELARELVQIGNIRTALYIVQ